MLGEATRKGSAVEVLPRWTNPETGRPAAISNQRLAQLSAEHLPVAVEGDPVQYQINRNQQGWVIELVHNGGVTKHPTGPVVVDPQAVARVTQRSRIALDAARQWGSKRRLAVVQPIEITIPPGGTTFIELTPHQAGPKGNHAKALGVE